MGTESFLSLGVVVAVLAVAVGFTIIIVVLLWKRQGGKKDNEAYLTNLFKTPHIYTGPGTPPIVARTSSTPTTYTMDSLSTFELVI